MNYTQNYYDYINYVKTLGRIKLKKNDPDYIYYELHHIIPKFMSGSNDENNLVLLTAREHWLAHYLLVKMFSTSPGAISSYWYISHKNGRWVSSKDYEKMKIALAEYRDLSGEKNGMFGKTHTKESKERMSKEKHRRMIEEGAGCLNKKAYHKDNEQKFFIEGTEPTGWVLGCKKKPFTVTKKFSEGMRNKCIKIQCVETGEIFTGYEEACQVVSLKSKSSICRSIKKGGTAGGFHWKKWSLPPI
jgi:hypothetical protein